MIKGKVTCSIQKKQMVSGFNIELLQIRENELLAQKVENFFSPSSDVHRAPKLVKNCASS